MTQKNDRDMTVLLLSCETVSTHFSVFWTISNAVQWFFPVTRAHMPGSSACSAGQALDLNQILTSFHCRNFGQVKRNQRNEPEVTTTEKYCYLEVTSTKFRELSCLRSPVAPQKHCSSCIIWSSTVTTPHSSTNAVGKFILSANAGKCRAGVLSEHQPAVMGIIR